MVFKPLATTVAADEGATPAFCTNQQFAVMTINLIAYRLTGLHSSALAVTMETAQES